MTGSWGRPFFWRFLPHTEGRAAGERKRGGASDAVKDKGEGRKEISDRRREASVDEKRERRCSFIF